MINPQPKPETIRLYGADYTKFRRELSERATDEFGTTICESCGKYAPLYVGDNHFDEFFCGQVHHLDGKKGGDVLERCLWVCFSCHRGTHNGKRRLR